MYVNTANERARVNVILPRNDVKGRTDRTTELFNNFLAGVRGQL